MLSSGVSAQPPSAREPLSANVVLSVFANELTCSERAEIVHYPRIYYWGQTWKSLAQGRLWMQQQSLSHSNAELSSLHAVYTAEGALRAPPPPPINASQIAATYDDAKGDYLAHMGDHLAFRYELLNSLGKGSFGQVYRVHDHSNGTQCAVKIIRNRRRFTMQGEVECQILHSLQQADPEYTCNAVKMIDNFKFRNHLCIVFELLSINLYEFIKSNEFRGFSIGLIRRFSIQIIACLTLLQQHNIVHCDLKPENVLLVNTNKSNIKVIDFGSSCRQNEQLYTYIQSRFYRSPEIILGVPYTIAVDMWSLGCMLAELFTGFPLFPGDNEHDQLSCIMEIMGSPPPQLSARCERKHLFLDANNALLPVAPPPSSGSSSTASVKTKPRKTGSRTLAQAVKCKDDLFLDFIARCLTWDPDKRMTPTQALQHPWIVGGDTQVNINNTKINNNSSADNNVGDPSTPSFRSTADRKNIPPFANAATRNFVATSAFSSSSPSSLSYVQQKNSGIPVASSITTFAKPRNLPPLDSTLGVPSRLTRTSPSSLVPATVGNTTRIFASSKPPTSPVKAASMSMLLSPPAPSAAKSFKSRASWATPTVTPLNVTMPSRTTPLTRTNSLASVPGSRIHRQSQGAASLPLLPTLASSTSALPSQIPTVRESGAARARPTFAYNHISRITPNTSNTTTTNGGMAGSMMPRVRDSSSQLSTFNTNNATNRGNGVGTSCGAVKSLIDRFSQSPNPMGVNTSSSSTSTASNILPVSNNGAYTPRVK